MHYAIFIECGGELAVNYLPCRGHKIEVNRTTMIVFEVCKFFSVDLIYD